MISLVTLISLNGYAATYTVNGANSLQNAMNSACANPQGPHEIQFDTNPRDTYELGPGSIDGDVVIYPPIGCSNENNPPALTITSDSGGIASVKYQIQATEQHETLFTFRQGADITIRNLNIEGVLLLDYATIDPLSATVGEAPLGPDCALGGAYVRGIQISGTPSRTGSLTLDGVAMRCLDANDEGSGVAGLNDQNGGAILSFGVPVTLIDSLLYANSGVSGGAVAIFSGNTGFPAGSVAFTTDNVVFQNNASLFGGAVLFDWANKSAEIDFATFQGNEGQFGSGALDFRDMTNVSIKRTVFDRQNPNGFEVEQIGGAVRIERADDLVFENNLVCGSWAGEGGGLHATDVAAMNVEGNVFAENGALFYGGGLTVRRTQLAQGEQTVRVVNNSFIGNEAGRPPPFLQDPTIYALGGGGAAAFFGVNPEFRNNVVTFSPFGGGVFGDYIPFSSDGFQIGDDLNFYNNLFFENTDEVHGNAVHMTGEFASIAFHPSNLQGEDPQLVFSALTEFNCVPDAFFPLRTSPTIDAGGGPPQDGVPTQCADMVDTNPIPDFEHDTALPGQCDIGAFGGDIGLFAKDTDGDQVQNIFDCNDNNNQTFPGQTEICDFADNDCNGIVDDGLAVEWWIDADGDGFGDADAPKILSCDPIPGRVNNDGDCNDADPTFNEEASEVCNGQDNDCDGDIDDGLVFTQYFIDNDNDGFGATGSGDIPLCEQPVNGVTQGGDCVDTDITINPAAREICGDNLDNDCDGLFDALDDSADNRTVFFRDNDGDGYGDSEVETLPVCGAGGEAPDGLTTVGGDCDDNDATVNPGAMESCSNPGDEDCDGQLEEIDGNTIDATAWYPDGDFDQVGADINPTYVCADGLAPAGFVDRPGDCDDTDPLVQECSSCGCQASPTALQGALGLFVGMLGVLARRRR